MGQPQEHRIATSDGDICWYEWGAPGLGASVLLLHATGFHARLWDQVVAGLPTGTNVIAPDHRGHGRSFKPASLADWTGNAAALLSLVDRFAGTPLVGCGLLAVRDIAPFLRDGQADLRLRDVTDGADAAALPLSRLERR